MNTRRRQHVLTGAAAVCGLALFAYAVRRAGVDEIADGVRRVGWGALAVLGIAGVRFALRAQSWRLCMRSDVRLPFWRAFAAFLAGDAVGNITPLGLVASEPTKVLLTRNRLATNESVASLAIDNLVYATSALAMVGVGVVVVLATVPLSVEWRDAALVLLLALVAGPLVAMRLLRGTWSPEKGARPQWRERLAAVRGVVLAFWMERPATLAWVFALGLCFHALAVWEVFFVLGWVLGDLRPTLAQAIIFEALNRVVTLVFKFVPFRVGVDEALTGALAPILAVNPAAGVTLAVVRKARNLFWTGIGLLLIGVHRHRAPAIDRPGNVSARRT